MSSVPFPGPEQDDGDQPSLSPGVPARDGVEWSRDDDVRDGAAPAGADTDADWDADADLTRFLADVDAGREPVPEEDVQVPVVTFSLGETADVDPAVLAAMIGPDGLGGECFAAEKAADAMPPGPLLSALAEQAARDPRALSGDELLGVVSAARRLQNRAEYLELTAIAEFARRRAGELAEAKERKVPRGCRPGEFPGQELAMELVSTAQAAEERMDLATALATRLSATFAGMAAGVIDGGRAATIGYYTQGLSGEHAAYADEVLAAAAPGLRYDQLSRRAAALEMKLDPEAARRRKEDARKAGQRVEARREASGNMSYGGRELGTADALAAKLSIDADAAALRNGGVEGSLRYLRVLAFLDRLNGRNPLDRITARDGAHPSAGQPPESPVTAPESPRPGAGQPSQDPAAGAGRQPAAPVDDRDGDDDSDDDDRDDGDGDDGYGDDGDGDDLDGDEARAAGGATHPGGPAPLPALINLIVPAGTLLGWSGVPAEAGGWGLLDRDDTRDIVQAASMHPRTRWCVTLTGPDVINGSGSWEPYSCRSFPCCD